MNSLKYNLLALVNFKCEEWEEELLVGDARDLMSRGLSLLNFAILLGGFSHLHENMDVEVWNTMHDRLNNKPTINSSYFIYLGDEV